jgi:hypothetical protein
LLSLSVVFILAIYWLAAEGPRNPRPEHGKIYSFRIPSRYTPYRDRQVVYLTKYENLLIGPVTYVLVVTFVSIDLFVGYKLKRLKKRRAEENRASTDDLSHHTDSAAQHKPI